MGRFVYQCKQKKYNFDNLSQQDIEALIEDKIQKNIDKVLHNWEDEGFSGESVGTLCNYYKIKIELSKDVDATKLTLEEVQEMIAKKTPAKKVAAKKTLLRKLQLLRSQLQKKQLQKK
jgi:DNA topoisomerase-1